VHQWHRKDYPRKKDHIDVPDPKKIMEDALPNIQALKVQLSEAIMLLGFGLYDAEYDGKDAILALATPVQMLAQAVDTMSQVKDIGGKISAQKKKETILLIVSLVLMIVPFLSEVGFAVAGLSNLARLAFVAGEIANGAQSVYGIIDDPESAPFAVMGILAGAAGKTGKLEKTFADASAARKVLTDASAMVRISFTEYMWNRH
jgi:chitinase